MSDETLVRMPKLADTLVEGTLGQWLKKVGDTVERGEPLASIETDKVTTELSSPSAGTLLEVLVADGQTVPIETPIARIGTGLPLPPGQGEVGVAPAPRGPAPLDAGRDQPGIAPAPYGTAAPPPPKPTSVAARLLEEHGLSAAQITSRTGRLTRDDVLAFLQTRRVAPPRSTRPAVSEPMPGPAGLVPLSSMRRAIADHMSRAHQTIPRGQSVMAADLTALVAWREHHKDTFRTREGASLTFSVLFVYALARALEPPVDLGVAVALDGGLIVPVLRQAHALSLGATARGVADLADRARTSKLRPEETQGARMTVTNVGSFGNLSASPIVPMGQAGILGPGLVERRPLPAAEGGIRPGWRCLLSLMFDRRAVDDFAADRLLRRVVETLEHLPATAA